jgi:hypothetical protein
MRFILLLFLARALFSAEAYYCFVEDNQDDGKLHVRHGTCAIVGGRILTARHLLERDDNTEHGQFFVDVPQGRVRCDVVERIGKDLVWLKPRFELADTRAEKDGCYASVRGGPVKRLKAKPKDGLWRIEGFDHGGSGAPVYKDGKITGIAVAMRGELTLVEEVTR